MSEPSRAIITQADFERLQKLDAFTAAIQFDHDRRRLLELLAKGWRIAGVTVTDGDKLEHFAAVIQPRRR
jgi:hypothetical protein